MNKKDREATFVNVRMTISNSEVNLNVWKHKCDYSCKLSFYVEDYFAMRWTWTLEHNVCSHKLTDCLYLQIVYIYK